MPRVSKEFNKAEYDSQYHKEHYRTLAAVFTKEEATKVEEAAKLLGLSKSAFIKSAVLKAVEEVGN